VKWNGEGLYTGRVKPGGKYQKDTEQVEIQALCRGVPGEDDLPVSVKSLSSSLKSFSPIWTLLNSSSSTSSSRTMARKKRCRFVCVTVNSRECLVKMAERGSIRVFDFLNDSLTDYSRPRINRTLRLVGRRYDGRSCLNILSSSRSRKDYLRSNNSSHDLSVSRYPAKYR